MRDQPLRLGAGTASDHRLTPQARVDCHVHDCARGDAGWVDEERDAASLARVQPHECLLEAQRRLLGCWCVAFGAGW